MISVVAESLWKEKKRKEFTRTMLDVLSLIEQERSKQRSATSGAFFFTLRAGEKALIRALVDLPQMTVVNIHQVFDPSSRQFTVNAVCARDLGEECLHCQASSGNRKLSPIRLFLLPVWVHRIVDQRTGKPVMFTDRQGEEREAGQCVRLLRMKATSPIIDALLAYYREEGSIVQADAVIARTGTGLETTYSVVFKSPSTFLISAEVPTSEMIRSRMIELAPPAVQAEDHGSTAVPDVDEIAEGLDIHEF